MRHCNILKQVARFYTIIVLRKGIPFVPCKVRLASMSQFNQDTDTISTIRAVLGKAIS